jgi:hypothetical protein
MSPTARSGDADLARDLAEWLGHVRAIAPGLSLASLEAFLWVASGEHSSSEVHDRMAAAAPVVRTTVTRSLGLLRGRSQWRRDHWLAPLDWLDGRPHPHQARALAFRLSARGRMVMGKLSMLVLGQ